jgi:hypothetical protein
MIEACEEYWSIEERASRTPFLPRSRADVGRAVYRRHRAFRPAILPRFGDWHSAVLDWILGLHWVFSFLARQGKSSDRCTANGS